jgi:hypothetical protein
MSNGSDQTLDEVLRALAEEDRAQRAPARVEATLLREFRCRRRRRRLPAAAAAAALVVASIVVLRPGPPPRDAARPLRTEFIPVAYAEPLRPEESARIVRVRVPRTTLVSFGLPVNPERLDDRIEADVLLGEDNLVRAVRFEP